MTTHEKQLTTLTFDSTEACAIALAVLHAHSKWFAHTPLPDDRWQLMVKAGEGTEMTVLQTLAASRYEGRVEYEHRDHDAAAANAPRSYPGIRSPWNQDAFRQAVRDMAEAAVDDALSDPEDERFQACAAQLTRAGSIVTAYLESPGRDIGDEAKQPCDHTEHEDCLICRECGACSESLDAHDVCAECHEDVSHASQPAFDRHASLWTDEPFQDAVANVVDLCMEDVFTDAPEYADRTRQAQELVSYLAERLDATRTDDPSARDAAQAGE